MSTRTDNKRIWNKYFVSVVSLFEKYTLMETFKSKTKKKEVFLLKIRNYFEINEARHNFALFKEKSLGLHLSNNSVHLVFNLGNGPITTYNPLELKNDTWYNIYVIR